MVEDYENERHISEQKMAAKFAEVVAARSNPLHQNDSEGGTVTSTSKQGSYSSQGAEGKGYFEDGHEEMN